MSTNIQSARAVFDLGWIQVLATKASRPGGTKFLHSFFAYETDTFIEVFKITCWHGETITCQVARNGTYLGDGFVIQFDDLPELYQDWITR